MPATNLPSGQISFADIANGVCEPLSDVTMLSLAQYAQVDRSDNTMEINEFRGKQVLFTYDASNFDENYDYNIYYTDEYCSALAYGVPPNGSYTFTSVYGKVFGSGNGTFTII